jgi:hypothetical protein
VRGAAAGCWTAVVLALAPGLASAADGESVVATITDRRLSESSGMVQSTADPELAYIVNDSGNAPVVHVVELATGNVVGTARLAAQLVDSEALAIGADERLYVADIGDNAGERRRVDLYALDQPGRGSVTVTPQRYPVRYADGPHDAEALVSDVVDGSFHIVTKELFGGDVYRLGPLAADHVTVARRLDDAAAPGLVTDADVARAGAVVLRTYTSAYLLAVPGWKLLGSVELPDQRQGETVAVIDGGPVVYVGTEGLPSPLLEVRWPQATWRELDPRPEAQPPPDPPDPDEASPTADSAGRTEWALILGSGLLVALTGALVLRRRRRA